jgi:flagellar hook-associated protein FlgK
MNKDINSAKKYLSAGTIAMMEEGAKKMGKSLDEAFKESAEQSSTPAIPEFTNEKITGDTATVDMKAQGMSVTMPLVKEGGEWKLAMDKLINDMKNSTGSNGTESAVIDFSGDGKTTSSITFDEAEMRHLESRIEYGDSKAALDYVSRKMELMGLKCCEPRKRIDKCVWQCCDKSTISTCNKTLQAVLEKSEAQ